MTTAVENVRRFNRFYTAKVGALQRRFLDSDLSLPEARLLFELALCETETAADLVRRLGMDKGHVSRILERFRERGWIERRPSPDHAKRILLSLTEDGRAAFTEIDARQADETGRMIENLHPAAQERLSVALRAVEALLGETPAGAGPAFALRDPKPGEFAFTVARQAAIYHEEQGWGALLEASCARVVAEFIEQFDPARDRAWIADCAGAVTGSVFLTHSDDPETGKLRLLYVEPSARGLGIGSALVTACVGQARAFGYRRLALWTHAELGDAHRLYGRAGFRLVREEPHRTFGAEILGQFWELELGDQAAGASALSGAGGTGFSISAAPGIDS